MSSPTLALCVLAMLGMLVVGMAEEKRYANSWAVEVQGSRETADKVAAKYGFVNRGPVSVASCEPVSPRKGVTHCHSPHPISTTVCHTTYGFRYTTLGPGLCSTLEYKAT